MKQEKLSPFISKEEIEEMVARLAGLIVKEYSGKNPLLVGVLKGSFVFLSDLIRALNIPLEVDFVRLSSYGESDVPSEVRVTKNVETPIEGRHVLIVEDIVDTGVTLKLLEERMKSRNPESLKLCALLDKHSRREVEVELDYFGKNVECGFLVGYGLDFGERYRYLQDIFEIEE